ncbi:hypothetical protein EDM56_10930 [Brevibacillus fluminis]|uniref:Uncharacterized protein n=1 Tax=Brevibacillus fluminis TaxID=511487 RepID=A0A3M8DQH5_9BACL|nr:hypothetical protein [Brevibacillus fluminis]RNB89685.1 hypothetical protein EDM56_10930 [Brevibacillus fluminis]
MVTILDASQAEAFGVNGEKVVSLLNRLAEIEWFSAVGKAIDQESTERAVLECSRLLGIEGDPVQWLGREQVSSFLDDMRLEQSPLWMKIESVPRKIKEKAEGAGRLDALNHVIDYVPEFLFHHSFKGAFHAFETDGMRVVQVAVGATMYLFGVACAWETLSDLPGWETNPYLPLLEAFAAGHWPLGFYHNQFMIA